MMPTYPAILTIGRSKFGHLIRDLSRRGGISQDIPQHRHFEGKKGTIIREDNSTDTIRWKESSASITTDRIPLNQLTSARLLEMIHDISKQFHEEMSKHILSVMKEATDKSGNVIDGRGEKLSEHHIIAALKSLPPSFDDFGNFQPPTMVIHPDMVPRIKEMANSPDKSKYERQIDAIIEQKRNEHRSKEAGRRLAG